MRRDRLSFCKDVFTNFALWLSTTLSAGFCVEAVIDMADETPTRGNIGMLVGGTAGWLISLSLARYYRKNDAMWQQEKNVEMIALEISKGIVGYNIIDSIRDPGLIFGIFLSFMQFIELRNNCDFSIVPFLEHRVLQPVRKIEIASWVFDRLLEIALVFFMQSFAQDTYTQVSVYMLTMFLLLRKILFSQLWYTPLEIFGDSASGLQRERLLTSTFIQQAFCGSLLSVIRNDEWGDDTTAAFIVFHGVLLRRIVLLFGTTLSTFTILAIVEKINHKLYEKIFPDTPTETSIIILSAIMAGVCHIIFISHELGRGRPRGGYQQTALTTSTNTQILLPYQLSDHSETAGDTGIQHDKNNSQNYSASPLISSMSGSF